MGISPGSIAAAMPPHITDDARKQRDLERTQRENAAARSLAASEIGNGGTLQVDGSLVVTGTIATPGTLSTAGALSAGTTVTAGTSVSAGTSLNGASLAVTGAATVGGALGVTGDVSATNARLGGGTVYSPYAYSNPVTTSYLAAYINGPDGRFGATPSAQRFKQDIADKTYTLEQANLIQTVNYRLIAAVEELGDKAAVEVGVIAEQLISAGLTEFVAFDPESGLPLSVHYERLVIVALGALREVSSRLSNLETRLGAAGIA